jgi:hypothetical protein
MITRVAGLAADTDREPAVPAPPDGMQIKRLDVIVRLGRQRD